MEKEIYAHNENIVARVVHGSNFLIDITDDYSNDKCSLYELNDMGMYIWNCIDGHRTVEQIAAVVCEAIIDDVDQCTILSDVKEFLLKIKKQGFILEVKA